MTPADRSGGDRSVTISAVVHAYPGRPPVLALDGVDLDVAPASLLAVLGPSGSGKSTLLRVIAGFERPQAGRVVLGDRAVVDRGHFVPPHLRRVGIVPQEGALFPHLDVGGNIAFGLRQLDRRARRERVADLLDLVGLPGYESRRPRELSGGQQQRIALARALAPRPDLVLLDEPFSALDATLRTTVRDEVSNLLRAAGTTAVLVTHDRADATALADNIAVLGRGRVVQIGSPAEVYRHPADRETAELLGDANVVSGLVTGGVVDCSLGRLALDPSAGVVTSGKVDVLVRPESIVPCGPDDDEGVIAVVVTRRFHGGDYAMVLELPDGQQLTTRWSNVDPPCPGDAVAVTVNGSVWPLAGEDVGPHGESQSAIGHREGAPRHPE